MLGGGTNDALTVMSADMVRLQVGELPAERQAPPHPVKLPPGTEVALRTTWVPLTNDPLAPVQPAPQEIDAGTVATVPPAAPVLVSVRVCRTPMLSVSTATLLPVAGSLPVPPTVAVAVLMIDPVPVPDMTVAWTVYVAVPPTGRETALSEMLPLPEAVQLPPPPPTQVQLTPEICAGIASATVTAAAIDGPAFEAWMV